MREKVTWIHLYGLHSLQGPLFKSGNKESPILALDAGSSELLMLACYLPYSSSMVMSFQASYGSVHVIGLPQKIKWLHIAMRVTLTQHRAVPCGCPVLQKNE